MSYYFNFAPLIKIDMQRKRILITAATLLGVTSAFAFQPSGPPPTPIGLPIDGFVSIFLAAGAVIGIKSLKGKKE
jgi:hypothetical protein